MVDIDVVEIIAQIVEKQMVMETVMEMATVTVVMAMAMVEMAVATVVATVEEVEEREILQTIPRRNKECTISKRTWWSWWWRWWH